MLADVIGDSDGSRFYWALVDNAIAEDADFGFYPHDACGSFYIALTTDPERSDEALDIALGGTGEGQDRSERRRGRAGEEQDRQQPGAVRAKFRWAACASSAASGSTTSNTARWKLDMATLHGGHHRDRCRS